MTISTKRGLPPPYSGSREHVEGLIPVLALEFSTSSTPMKALEAKTY